MKNIILPLLVATLFFSSNTIFAAENGFGASMQADSNKLFQLQTAQDNNKEQFDKAFKKIKIIESQLPKLHAQLQSQLKTVQDNNNKMIKEIQQGYESQLKKLTKQLNTLKNRLDKKPTIQG